MNVVNEVVLQIVQGGDLWLLRILFLKVILNESYNTVKESCLFTLICLFYAERLWIVCHKLFSLERLDELRL